MPCPNLSGQRCKLYDSYQEEYQRSKYCLSRSDYTNCLNWKPNSANCPYFTGTYCNGRGGAGSSQSCQGSHKEDYCLNSSNCTRCANFG